MLRIETLAIGDELLTGVISDTNSTFVARTLFEQGQRLAHQSVIADDVAVIQNALKECGQRADFIVCFGGLGPTSDDKTASAVAELLQTRVETHEPSKERLLSFYKKRGRTVTDAALKQVLYPAGTDPLPNPEGMAPGFACQVGQGRFFFLPGVPREMKAIFLESVLPEILKATGGHRIQHHTWRLLGIPESDLQKAMDPVEAKLPAEAWLGYRTHYPENHLTFYYRGSDERFREECSQDIRERLRPWTFTEDKKTLEELVLDRLRELGATVAVAESCTGGLVAHRLTQVAGASESFWGGVTVYQTPAKLALLGVAVARPQDAVSADCTRALAENLKTRSGATLTAAITGYMGPTGGTAADPLGTVYYCLLWKEKKVEKKVALPIIDRERAQWGAASLLLNAIRSLLETSK